MRTKRELRVKASPVPPSKLADMDRDYGSSIMKRLVFVLTLLASNGAGAQDQKTIRALNNLHDEMLACISYYTIGHACTKDQAPPEITERTAGRIKSVTEGTK